MTFNPLEVVVAIQLDKVESLKKFVPSLIPYDGHLNIPDTSIPIILHEGATLLSFAVYNGSKEVVNFLLRNGASPEVKDRISFLIFQKKIPFFDCFLTMNALQSSLHR